MTHRQTTIAAVIFLAIWPVVPTIAAGDCPGFAAGTQTGHIAQPAVDEASGLAASWRHQGMLWTHNDSGGRGRLFLVSHDGSPVATVTLDGVDEPADWEDVAVGPCAKGSQASCVYVADIGDNHGQRQQVVIYRFREPGLPTSRPADVSVSVDEQRWFTYPGGPRNAETVMVHPKSAAVYVVDKTAQSRAGVYRIPASTDTGKSSSRAHPALAVEVGQLRINGLTAFGRLVTAGDISPNGAEFTVRTYLAVYTFCKTGDDFESAVQSQPTRSSPPFMAQGEALGYGRRGDTIWLTTERQTPPLYRMNRQ